MSDEVSVSRALDTLDRASSEMREELGRRLGHDPDCRRHIKALEKHWENAHRMVATHLMSLHGMLECSDTQLIKLFTPKNNTKDEDGKCSYSIIQ